MSPTRKPFRSIVVPVDGSPIAEQAIPVALEIARRADSSIRLVLVHREFSPLLVMEPAEVYVRTVLAFEKFESDYLRALTHRVETELGRQVSSAALKGPVNARLAEYIADIGADLVVMTTHGRGGVRRAWLGSVTDHLIRTSKVPVLCVRAREGVVSLDHVRAPEILVPLDGSPLSEAVLEPVAALAQLWDARVSLVQVVQPVFLATDPALPLPTGYDEQLTAMQRDAANDYMKDLAERLQQRGVQATGVAVLGHGTAETILEIASSKQVGLIALSTHGRGGLRRLALGSVADKMIRAAEVPVLVVRPAAPRRRSKQQDQEVRTHQPSTAELEDRGVEAGLAAG
jgi:nucleotide-binding universal stress UspA family protein